jgi:hypothetical protein
MPCGAVQVSSRPGQADLPGGEHALAFTLIATTPLGMSVATGPGPVVGGAVVIPVEPVPVAVPVPVVVPVPIEVPVAVPAPVTVPVGRGLFLCGRYLPLVIASHFSRLLLGLSFLHFLSTLASV